jgi:hypothetical protein
VRAALPWLAANVQELLPPPDGEGRLHCGLNGIRESGIGESSIALPAGDQLGNIDITKARSPPELRGF